MMDTWREYKFTSYYWDISYCAPANNVTTKLLFKYKRPKKYYTDEELLELHKMLTLWKEKREANDNPNK